MLGPRGKINLWRGQIRRRGIRRTAIRRRRRRCIRFWRMLMRYLNSSTSAAPDNPPSAPTKTQKPSADGRPPSGAKATTTSTTRPKRKAAKKWKSSNRMSMIWPKKYPPFSKFCPYSTNTHPNRSSKTWPSRKKLPKSARRAPCSSDIRSMTKWSARWTTSRQPWRIWHRGSRCCRGIFPRGKKKLGKNTRKNRGKRMRGVNLWKKRLSNWNMEWIVISGCCWRARFRRKRKAKMKSKKMWTWLRNKCKMKRKRCWAPRRWPSET